MNIGIFSGSFNPIHAGHLILANYIAEYTDLDEVWLMVSPKNPLKDNAGLLDASVRYQMVCRAVEGFRHIQASDFEMGLPTPNYTIDTLDCLSEAYPEHTFHLIVGADNWSVFRQWKDYKRILTDYSLMVYPRSGYPILVHDESKAKVEILNSPIIEISATFIRQGIDEGKNLKAFLPEKVYEYILANKLYTK